MDVHNRTFCLLVVALLFVNPELWARHSESIQKIPFKLYRNHLIVVTGTVGGIVGRNLLIDSGASPSVIDESIAQELGLKAMGRPENGMSVVGGVVQIYYTTLESLDIGPLHRKGMVVAVANLSLLKTQAGVQIDAIIGMDALSPDNFQIDYESSKLQFGNIKMPRSAIPMMQESSLPTVELQVNEERLKLMVDTGSSQLVLFRGKISDSLNGQHGVGSTKIEDLAGEVEAHQVRLKQVKLGGIDLSGSTAILATSPVCCKFQGILGVSALHFKRISFDFQHRLLGIEVRDLQAEEAAKTCFGYLAVGSNCGPLSQLARPLR